MVTYAEKGGTLVTAGEAQALVDMFNDAIGFTDGKDAMNSASEAREAFSSGDTDLGAAYVGLSVTQSIMSALKLAIIASPVEVGAPSQYRQLPPTKGPPVSHTRYQPYIQSTDELAAGDGMTDGFGNIRVSSLGTDEQRALALAHESVHSRLVVKPGVMFKKDSLFPEPPLDTLRQVLAQTLYKHSGVMRGLEEALAESSAQLQVNGVLKTPGNVAKFMYNNSENYKYWALTGLDASVGLLITGGILYYRGSSSGSSGSGSSGSGSSGSGSTLQ